MMKMILREAVEKDLPAVKSILEPWRASDPGILELVHTLVSSGPSALAHCRVLEADHVVRCVSLWVAEEQSHVRLLALGLGPGASDIGADTRFLREEIMEWADLGVSKVTAHIPDTVASDLIPCLRECGFMFEGICTTCRSEDKPWITFCKHFLYRSIDEAEVIDFLRDFLVNLGYEVRREGEGFSYRVRSEFRLPFIFSSWHRVTRSGPDLILHPPARVLEWNELETLFYPFTVGAGSEKPLLIPLEKKRATDLIEMPRDDNHQDSLFGAASVAVPRLLPGTNVACSDAVGVQGLRKGLRVLFYVNRVGAVGTARVEDWLWEDAATVSKNLLELAWLPRPNGRQASDTPCPKAGKVLAVRFQWYKPLKRPVRLEDIKSMDHTFNPQRLRSVSPRLFGSIVEFAGSAAPRGVFR
ncbi:MAG: hypothetical protein HY914_04875 [Desulfomonile tiedjei]|nr:hypothetical protein [Desulfomonile tiedjei]